ncbi:MAG: glycosyltransferase family 9 protein [Elusimicrobiota bacterium]|jgi:ADP-heptose:LPS heptosyltransferase|nr:glycosyltransferase family 9 protein [Elusimicrobiota bacterium]
MKILIIKPSSFGDIVQALPSANALKSAYPGCHIAWVVFNQWAAICELCPDIDEIITWDRTKGISGFFAVVKKLYFRNFDLIIDLQGLLRSAFLARLLKGKTKIGVSGMKEFSNLLLKEIEPQNAKINATIRNLKTISFATKKFEEPKVNIKIPIDTLEQANKILSDNGVSISNHCGQDTQFLPASRHCGQDSQFLPASRHCGLDPQSPSFASKTLCGEIAGQARNDKTGQANNDIIALLPFARGKGKDWSIENYLQLIDLLKQKYPQKQIIILGIQKDFGRIKSDKAIDLCGQTDLKQLSAILSKSYAAIGADTGSMHLACLLNTPSIFIFGISNIKETAPYIGKFSLLINEENAENINAIQPQTVLKSLEQMSNHLKMTLKAMI